MECLPNFVVSLLCHERIELSASLQSQGCIHAYCLAFYEGKDCYLSVQFWSSLEIHLLYVSYAKNPLNSCMHCFKVGLQWQHLIRSQLEKAWGTTRFFISGSNKECSMHIFSNMYSFSCCFHLSVQGICLGVLNRLMSKQCSTLYLHKQGPA